MLARLVLAGLAVLAAVVAIRGLHSDHDCKQLIQAVATQPRGQLPGLARQTLDRCGDPRDRVVVASVLVARRQRPDAVAVVRRMTASEPDDYLGWLVLGRTTGERAALERAHELNPRVVPRP
jgi:hypothetical protein